MQGVRPACSLRRHDIQNCSEVPTQIPASKCGADGRKSARSARENLGFPVQVRYPAGCRLRSIHHRRAARRMRPSHLRALCPAVFMRPAGFCMDAATAK